MRAGRLRHQVDIRQELRTPDGAGGYAATWAFFATGVWAEVIEGVGREVVEGMAIESHALIEIHIRYLTGITTKMRVYYNSAIYEIVGLSRVGSRDFELILQCEERVANTAA